MLKFSIFSSPAARGQISQFTTDSMNELSTIDSGNRFQAKTLSVGMNQIADQPPSISSSCPVV